GTFAIAFVLLTLTTLSFAQQVQDVATASATIIAPIGITKTLDMDFGNIAVGATGGTVILAPASTRSLGVPGTLVLPTVFPGNIQAATFTVSGAAGYTYAITLPGTATTINNGANTMTVDTWTSNPTPTGTIGGLGTDVLTVGGTLHVGNSQAAGLYVSATPFVVKVEYN
ncbi:MAG: DUF4402 domain-containing protein, partial [Bacteroidota bacterium]